MLTKDKKPFTYTPGGLDLSEIRSPRMARRLERNAMNEGVGPLPQAQPHPPTGPLPPSVMAAMQPQLSVQVFPAGGIPQRHHGGGPPPPPPPSGMPPPPPKAPPMRTASPLPLDPFERPDMTKIIPENPMALLRKTSGPVIKRDPIFNRDNYKEKDVGNSSPPPRQPVQTVKQPESPQKTTAGVGSIYVPPVNQNASPATPPNRQPQSPQFVNQRESSPAASRAPPAYYKRQPSTPQPEPQSPPYIAQKLPPAASTPPLREPQSPDSPKVSLSKAPTPWLQKRPQQQDAPQWAVNDQRTQSPPTIQVQQKVEPKQELQPQQQQSAPWRQPHPLQSEPQQWQQRQQQPEPQPWQQKQPQQPEAQPWQQRQQQQPEPQLWQQKQQQQQPEPQPWQQKQQHPQPQTPPWQQQQQSPPIQVPKGGGVKKQVQQRQNQQESGPTERTEVVIVNEPPQVFHHPGPTQKIIIRQQQPQQNNNQQPQQRLDSPGTRVIPVQIEGASSNGHAQPQVYVHKFNSPGGTPTTPGNNSDARSLNRQLSWNSNPTQSNTFRVLQKMTSTDGDDDEYQPITEHSPKMPNYFPQRQTSRSNDGDQELMNKFKQEFDINDYYEYPRYRGGHIPSKLFWMLDDSGLDQDSSLHKEVDPRYRGPHIPSKAFKLLQSMTGGPDEPPISSTVPQGQSSNNRGPKVRTIPIQIEGDGPTKPYVPPSEQTVQEPKKYMGSSIPSRSFKMLQAMTAPDDCANPVQACENNENYANDPSSYTQWGFDPNYPPPSPYYLDPYWNYYSQNYAPPNNNNNSRMTPIPPAWGYCPPAYSQNSLSSENSDSNSESPQKKATSSRTTPIPPNWTNDNESAKKHNGNARCTPVPFWPYYYPNYPYESPQSEANQESQETDTNGNTTNTETQQNYPQYPPYWDPYYYGYYYGAPPPMYPPVYSPYPFYPQPQTDSEEVSGYSSNDEMAYYGARFASMPQFANKKSKNAVTPSLQKQLLQEITEAAKKLDEKRKNTEQKQKPPEKIKIQSEPFDDDSSVAETSDSESEMIGYEVCRHPTGGLKAIRSVSDINVYDGEESSHCSDDDTSDATTEEIDDTSSVCAADETIPHQLSVIFEESERTDSAARYVRESSVATTISEGTATIENSEAEEEDEDETAESDGTVFVKLPLTFKFNVAENEKVATLVVGNSEIKPEIVVDNDEEESNVRKEANQDETEQDLLTVNNGVTRQVSQASSDSYQTAESDAEVINIQNSNVDVNYNNKQIRLQNEEEEIDWWGELSKDDDYLPKVSKRNESEIVQSNIAAKDEKEGENRSNSIVTDNYDNTDVCDTKIENKEIIQTDAQYKTKEEKDCWPHISYSKQTTKADIQVEQTKRIQEQAKPYTKQTKSNNQETTSADSLAHLQNGADSVKCSSNKTPTVYSPELKEKASICEEEKNDSSMKEGMETVETVLTNIISTINRRTSISGSSEEEKSEEVDFWAEIMNSAEKLPEKNSPVLNEANGCINLETADTRSACSRNSSLSSSKVSQEEENVSTQILCNMEDEPGDKFSYETSIKTDNEHCRFNIINNETENTNTANSNSDEVLDSDIKLLSVQERIKALHESTTFKHSFQQEEEEAETKVSVKERISVFEDSHVLLNVDRNIHRRKSTSRKSSIKSYEEFSEEEEGDSGVTSDISRHISETDTEPDFLELKKLNKYQRASTHSRLFKLLQDECDNEEVPTDFVVNQNTCMQSRRELLNLPLQKNGSDPESFSSSGFTSPGSPTVNERLVNELVQSLLTKKQGKIFKHMTMEKIQAAALRILQEDMDGLETLSSSEDVSPKKSGTGNSTPAQTPQEFYANFNEYSQYYESWAEAARLYEAQCDILPSKAFKLIQEHAAANKTGAVAGLLARCPRVLSNKNVQKELIRLMARENSSPSPDPHQQPPHANEATNAS